MSAMDIWMRLVPSILLLGVAVVLYYFAVKNHKRAETAEGLAADLQAERDAAWRIVDTARDLVVFRLTRYEISLTDWGPDFTGEDDTLPRWRWVVKDADYYLRGVLGTPDEPAGTGVLMLGNEATAVKASLAALEWVEQQRHPQQKVTSVIVGEVEPHTPPVAPPLASNMIGHPIPQGHVVNINPGPVTPYRQPTGQWEPEDGPTANHPLIDGTNS